MSVVAWGTPGKSSTVARLLQSILGAGLNRSTWQYRNVPDSVWQEFLEAPSMGGFIHDVLDHYEHGPANL